jgi:hypothetical protein
MNKEIQYIRQSLLNTLQGQPWYGKPVYSILEAVNQQLVYVRPGGQSHSLIELLYHMIIWTEFTRSLVQDQEATDVAYFDRMDWQDLDPARHTWTTGLVQFRQANEKILDLLEAKEDSFLGGMVSSRQYNFRFLLHGLTDHHIYHAGQIACLSKVLG